ncbi:MAG: hypothetical protein ABI855_04415 [Bacteroidota bacterium]
MEKRKRGTKNPSVIGIHLGNLLNEKIKEQRLSKTEAGRKIKRPPTAIKPLLSRPSMQAYLLWELSIALEYDFFSHLSQALLEKLPDIKGVNPPGKATIAALQKEVTALSGERDYLKKMIDIMAK